MREGVSCFRTHRGLLLLMRIQPFVRSSTPLQPQQDSCRRLRYCEASHALTARTYLSRSGSFVAPHDLTSGKYLQRLEKVKRQILVSEFVTCYRAPLCPPESS
eukprot:Hpha_TRINITY_DN23164_c0_g1::TRINITY_DN23164_c0_g1_i1::g.29502::m.29502